MEKKCRKCKRAQPRKDFYKNKRAVDGLANWCKSCQKEYYKLNADKIKKYQKEYYKLNADKIKKRMNSNYMLNADKIKKYHKEYRTKNKEKIKNRERRYVRTERGKLVRRTATYRYWNKYPERYKAGYMLNNGVKRGIVVQQSCVICGTNKDIEGHHENYSKPLEVIWLCQQHHIELHKRYVNNEN